MAAELAEVHRDNGDLPAARRLFAVAHAGAYARLTEDHPFTRSIEEELEAVEPVMPTHPVSAPPARRRWLSRRPTPPEPTPPEPTQRQTDAPQPTRRQTDAPQPTQRQTEAPQPTQRQTEAPQTTPRQGRESHQDLAQDQPSQQGPPHADTPDRPPAEWPPLPPEAAAPWPDTPEPIAPRATGQGHLAPTPQPSAPWEPVDVPPDHDWSTSDVPRPAERHDWAGAHEDPYPQWWDAPPPDVQAMVRPPSHPWKKALIFTASAVIALVVGVVTIVTIHPPHKTPAAAPPQVTQSAVGEGLADVPLGASLRDDGQSLTVTWAAQRLSVVVALSRAGGTPVVIAALPPGATSYVVRGLERGVQYCVVIGTAADGAAMSAATSVCTRR
jgi:hypothetical protein